MTVHINDLGTNGVTIEEAKEWIRRVNDGENLFHSMPEVKEISKPVDENPFIENKGSITSNALDFTLDENGKISPKNPLQINPLGEVSSLRAHDNDIENQQNNDIENQQTTKSQEK